MNNINDSNKIINQNAPGPQDRSSDTLKTLLGKISSLENRVQFYSQPNRIQSKHAVQEMQLDLQAVKDVCEILKAAGKQEIDAEIKLIYLNTQIIKLNDRLSEQLPVSYREYSYEPNYATYNSTSYDFYYDEINRSNARRMDWA